MLKTVEKIKNKLKKIEYFYQNIVYKVCQSEKLNKSKYKKSLFLLKLLLCLPYFFKLKNNKKLNN